MTFIMAIMFLVIMVVMTASSLTWMSVRIIA